MATPAWQPGTLYPQGSLVRPTGPLAPPAPVLTNPNFTSNSTGWTLIGSGAPAWSATGGFSDPGCIKMVATGEFNDGGVESQTFQCIPGQSISASFMGRMASGTDGTSFGANIRWYDASSTFISNSAGPSRVRSATGSGWAQASVSASAPAGSAYFSVFASLNTSASGSNVFYVDNFTVASSGGAAPQGLVYKAVQTGVGTSAASEPVWPTTVGLTVVDNTVTWEAVIATRITYKAVPILKSGATEPTWPQGVGTSVPDGTISWLTDSRQVTQAPNSNVVAITASKVYAADKDIIRYSATINPLDWTSTDDAGYLPSGLNQNGSNDTAVLNIYRGSLVSFSSTTFQNWQVDPDPANMSLLDVMEGIGSTWQHAAQPVAKDLFYLAKLGVRTVGISAGSTNLVNGDVGMPIDPLVRESINEADAGMVDPLGLYYPSLGQYWLMFPKSEPIPPGEAKIYYLSGESATIPNNPAWAENMPSWFAWGESFWIGAPGSPIADEFVEFAEWNNGYVLPIYPGSGTSLVISASEGGSESTATMMQGILVQFGTDGSFHVNAYSDLVDFYESSSFTSSRGDSATLIYTDEDGYVWTGTIADTPGELTDGWIQNVGGTPTRAAYIKY